MNATAFVEVNIFRQIYKYDSLFTYLCNNILFLDKLLPGLVSESVSDKADVPKDTSSHIGQQDDKVSNGHVSDIVFLDTIGFEHWNWRLMKEETAAVGSCKWREIGTKRENISQIVAVHSNVVSKFFVCSELKCCVWHRVNPNSKDKNHDQGNENCSKWDNLQEEWEVSLD